MIGIPFIYLTRKAGLLTLIIMAINLLAPLISALNVSLDYPSSIFLDREFNVSISSIEVNGTFDLKLFVHDDTKEFSEIYHRGEWNSPYRYLEGIFPEKTTFSLISHYNGNTSLCARFRKTGESSFTDFCEDIEIKNFSQKSENNQTNETTQNKNNTKIEETLEEEKTSSNKQTPERPHVSELSEPSEIKDRKNPEPKKEVNEPIHLNSPGETTKETTIITDYERRRLNLIYFFTLFTVLVIILLALDKL